MEENAQEDSQSGKAEEGQEKTNQSNKTKEKVLVAEPGVKFSNRTKAVAALVAHDIPFPVVTKNTKNKGKATENLLTLQERYDAVAEKRELKKLPIKGAQPSSLEGNGTSKVKKGDKPVFHRPMKRGKRNPMNWR